MKTIFFSMLIAASMTVLFFIVPTNKSIIVSKNKSIAKQEPPPDDWFFRQRAFPSGQIKYEAVQEASIQAMVMKNTNSSRKKSLLQTWQFAGPSNIGGRVSCVAMHPSNLQKMYISSATGGIFKSNDAGTTWFPVFDAQPSLSMGDIAIAPSNAAILYAGTGEPNCGGGSMTYDGMGIYKSIDSGISWTSVGLAATRNTGRIAIHPTNPNIVYVAAMGDLFGDNANRGIYKTTDGGANWTQVLFVSDSTGGIDLVINPTHPDTVFATVWERIRRPDRESYGGATCNIYRSYNGGVTWTILTTGLPSSSATVGRIGIDISQSNPATLYAIYAQKTGPFQAIYKTINNGDTWTAVNGASLTSMYATYGWWNGRIKIDPTNPNTVYAIGFDVYKTVNGGSTWTNLTSGIHPDQHAVYVHPLNPNFVLLGNDGGVSISPDGGITWNDVSTLPITQFYSCEIDNLQPTNLYGGAQDNGTNYTPTGNTNDWQWVYGGDGMCVKVDPTNSFNQFFEYQYGASTFGTFGTRQNWKTPFVLDPLIPTTTYYGAEKLYKNGFAISPDLTHGPGSGNLVYGTITTIAVSKANTNTIYVGTDDGNVQVTTNGGSSWTNVTGTLPVRWITCVAADPINSMVAYVTISGYRYDEYLPHVFRTSNGGASWQDISSNLPQAPVNDLVIDPLVGTILYAATDVGVYYTLDLGQHWQLLANGLPNVPITQLCLHNATHTLVAATYGRSMYKLDISLVTSMQNLIPEELTIKCYPNPVTTQILFSINKELNNASLKIYNLKGQEVFSKTGISGKELSINRAFLPSGIYFYKWNAEGKNVTGKLVLE